MLKKNGLKSGIKSQKMGIKSEKIEKGVYRYKNSLTYFKKCSLIK